MSYWYPLSVPTLGEAEFLAVDKVLRSGRTTMGARVEEFEAAFAAKVGARHAVMVNSGSSADLLIAFAAVGDGLVSRRDEVLVPAVTWPTQVWPWKMAGLNLRVVDVCTESLNTTAHLLRERITEHTRAISLVHLMGVPCDLAPIREVAQRYGLVITEDCCEALGASYGGYPVGSFGVMASWSFFFSHHMTTMEGGCVTTDSPELADRLRCLRSHGWARHLDHLPHGLDRRYTFVTEGFNLRPTEVAAAIGLVQLTKLDDMNRGRQANYTMFADALGDHPALHLPRVPPLGRASWFGIPIMVSSSAPFSRDQLAAHLEAGGVETRPILAGNLARQPAFEHMLGIMPGAEQIHNQGLYIGLHPAVNSDLVRVASLIDKAYPGMAA